MSIVCVWSPSWSTGEGRPDSSPAEPQPKPVPDSAAAPELGALLLAVAPRVMVGGEVVWADARGLPAAGLAASLLDRLAAAGVTDARAGVACIPVAAELAAKLPDAATRGRGDTAIDNPGDLAASLHRRVAASVVEPGREREFLSPLPLSLLGSDARLLELLEGVGVGRCGELAALPREAVEVRFGPDAVRLWRLARGDDRRRLFGPPPRELPSASLDFVDYVLTDPARLIFTTNALLSSILEALQSKGRHARRLVLTLSLANGGTWERVLRPARPTASRERLLRLLRGVLERITVPDAVAGVGLRVDAAEEAAVRQGDLFDRGFATEGAVEDALARLIEAHGEVVVAPDPGAHPLAERRFRLRPLPPDAATRRRGDTENNPDRAIAASPPRRIAVSGGGEEKGPGLTLQLLAEPRRIEVDTERRRDHVVPTSYHDRAWRTILEASGPDRVSGGQWEQPYAREYFRCITGDGRMVWIFHDALASGWYLHGWWD